MLKELRLWLSEICPTSLFVLKYVDETEPGFLVIEMRFLLFYFSLSTLFCALVRYTNVDYYYFNYFKSNITVDKNDNLCVEIIFSLASQELPIYTLKKIFMLFALFLFIVHNIFILEKLIDVVTSRRTQRCQK